MRKPELNAMMVKILNEIMPQVLKAVSDEKNDINSAYWLFNGLSERLSKYMAPEHKISDQEMQAAKYLDNLNHAVVHRGHDSLESVSEFANLLARVADPQVRQALLRIATVSFESLYYSYLTELEKKVLINRATSRYATLEDKIDVTQAIFDPKIVRSALALLDEEAKGAFMGIYPDMSKINRVKKQASRLKKACDESYQYASPKDKDGYVDGIQNEIEEFLNDESLFAKYDKHNDRLGQPEYMIQDVVPGTEKHIVYTDDREEQPEQEKTSDSQHADTVNSHDSHEESDSQQVTIVEMQQKKQIINLRKQIADMQKQIEDLRKENEKLQRETQESISKSKRFQRVSEELQQELNAKNKENEKLQTEKDQLTNMGKGELLKRFLFGNEKK